ncbi:MAG: type I restriction endonuclease subunit R [Kiritimatiellae bacterium]|nr:type I restriction endonuclease subunit R [Kiritimatiellia bacterium]
MTYPYTEDQLVEQPAIGLFAELGWQTVCAMEETFGAGGTLGRETRGEVVLVSRLREAMMRLNPSLPDEAINTAIDELTRDRSAMSLPAANREVYDLLKNGIKVSIAEPEETPSPGPTGHPLPEGEGLQNERRKARTSPLPSSPLPLGEAGVRVRSMGEGLGGEGSRQGSGGQRLERVRVIDWENPATNDFLLVSQFSVTGALYTCRPDLVGFVNGLPFVVIELKKLGVPAQQAFDENLTHYKAQIPSLFWYNALLIASNGTESRVGSLTADWERFFEWKRIASEDEKRRVSLETILRGTCDKARLLDLLENFTLFSEHKTGLAKIVGQNHQYLGVNNAIASMLKARGMGHGRAGVFWQTQGSGKSFSMVFFAQKVLRKLTGNWTFVVVTDRVELDDQIAGTFKAAGAVSKTEGDECHASSGAHLRDLLRGNHRYIFTLVHKFRTELLTSEKPSSPSLLPKGEGSLGQPSQMPVLSDRADIIVMVDEAHRSQYDTLALNMRAALPNAQFLAFTGTPLIAGEERTKEVFGDYVSIYDFQQSVEDGATVPLFYENRTPELMLVNPDLNEDIYNVVEAAELDPDQEEKLERELKKQYHILTRNDRLETIAKDIVRHFLGRGFVGKAMVVSIDKATALKMHDKVRKHWEKETRRVELELKRNDLAPDTREELKQRLEVLNTTDMALIVSPGQNEIAHMKKLGLDIEPHRKRMYESEPPLDEKFKDSNDPLRMVFVCAMWLTGFDAPSCSTIYLDKPMRNHTLMQTIARANRVFPGKHSGMIVDYANVFASLEKALAIYGAGTNGQTPVKDKQKLVEELRIAVKSATDFCEAHQVILHDIESLPCGSLDRLRKMDDAVNALISPDPQRRDFLGHVRVVNTLYCAVKPDPAAIEFAARVACLVAIAEAILVKINPGGVDISAVMQQINAVLDSSITGINMPSKPAPVMDLSKIDFEALAKRFKKSKTKNTDLEALKAAIRAQLERMISLNKTRMNFREEFEKLIDEYNAGSWNIEEMYNKLLHISHNLTDEEKRHVREEMSEEELVIFDILTRPAPRLSPEERTEVKKVAHILLPRIKELLVINWRNKSSARSQVKITIEDVLDIGLPRSYSPDIYQSKCSAVFEHVYESYPERNAGVYTSSYYPGAPANADFIY